jgi:hypothetical protein
MFGSWFIWGFGYETVWQRLTTQVDGTVTSSQDVPATGASRYVTEYIIQGLDGQTQAYLAGPTDASLQRSLPVGTHIHKKRGELGYEVDGRWIAFPMASYSQSPVACSWSACADLFCAGGDQKMSERNRQ